MRFLSESAINTFCVTLSMPILSAISWLWSSFKFQFQEYWSPQQFPFCPGVFQSKHTYHLFVFLIGDLYFIFFSYHEKFDRFELTHAIIPRPYVCIHIEIHINHHKRIRCLCTPRRMAHNYFSNERIRAYFALLSVFFPSNAILFWQDLFKQNGDRNLNSIWTQAICHIYCFECLTHRETHVWFFFRLLFRIHYNFGLIGICVFEGSMRLNRFLSNSNQTCNDRFVDDES